MSDTQTREAAWHAFSRGPVVAAIVMVLAAPTVLAFTADELVNKNIEAKGGLDKLHAIQTLRLSGKLLLNGGSLELGYVTLVKRPGSIRYEALLQGLMQIQAYDGTQAWQINPFQGRKEAEKLSVDDAKGLGEDALDFSGTLVDYKSKGYTLDYLGTEDVDGTEAHKLRVTRSNGDLTYVYLDPDHFLEIRTVDRRIEHGVPHETVTDYGDYEKVNGVYFAFAQESGPKGSSDRQKIQFDQAQANVAADDSEFQFPAVRPSAVPAK
ncbi:MAG: LolA family protein [Steroidobacteraceae bacterium]